ncbi:ABC transporter permease [Sporichthya polymorpha]|uniref:ABC transporter permease n=1 Tax=Sporichthya polymorpha TaxID=35751 RepID=UPI00036E1745|nr:ABC transporter permease [Sporichthya polymorpha]
MTDSIPEPLGSRVAASPRSHRRGGHGPAWSLGSEIAWAISDAGVLTRRNLLHTVRVRELWPFMFLQPLVFVFLFALVFGGAITIPGGGSYREFLLAGVFAQAVAFSTYPTTIAMAYDLQLGLMDRLRTLPIHPAAVFVGRTVGDVARMSISLTVMAVAGLIVGWRIEDGAVRAVAAFGVLLLFGFAMSWVGAYLGLVAKSVQAAQSMPMMWLFPVVFVSNAFVPTQTMPEPLETVAEWNPVTAVAAAARELFGNPNPFRDEGTFPAEHPVLLTVLWSVGIICVAATLCTRRMRRVRS